MLGLVTKTEYLDMSSNFSQAEFSCFLRANNGNKTSLAADTQERFHTIYKTTMFVFFSLTYVPFFWSKQS